jgi:hypothetical protein
LGKTMAVGCKVSKAAGARVNYELWRNSKKVAALGSAKITGSVVSTTLKIPSNIPRGTGYKMRVISANSPKLWDEGVIAFSIQK